MSGGRFLHRLFAANVIVGLALFVVGCGPRVPAKGPVPDAQSSFAAWTPAEVESATSTLGLALDLIDVRGGQLVRIVTDRPIDVGERVRTGGVSAETWWKASPKDGVVVLRTSLFATALIAPQRTFADVQLGRGSDPGVYWFDLEARVLDWAGGPLPAPFPHVAQPDRIDLEFFQALDHALQDDVAHAKNHEAASELARSIRRVAGLRAIRALRPASGFPYFFNYDVDGRGGAVVQDGTHSGYQISPDHPVELTVEGPQLLYVWTKAQKQEAEETLDLRVMEGKKERASSLATVARATTTTTSAEAAPGSTYNAGATLLPLRRALIHVPPGAHTYQMKIAGGPAVVFPITAKPVLHLGDAFAGTASETSQLERAKSACGNASGICAMAMALRGEDREASWTTAIAATGQISRAVAEDISAGAPQDPTLRIERAASRGDSASLTKLSAMAGHTVDEAVRHAWVRALEKGTEWGVADAETGDGTWAALFLEHKTELPICRKVMESTWPEVTDQEANYKAGHWHGVPTVEFVATGPCDGLGAVELSVDGDNLNANPGGALVHWHVRVAGDVARVSRKDRGATHVYAIPVELAACGATWESVRAPHIASTSPKLTFGESSHGPGLEIWLQADSVHGEVVVTPLRADAGESFRIVVDSPKDTGAKESLAAIDDKGVRWLRVARVALPAWAAVGVQIGGPTDVAVRAMTRKARTPTAGAERATTLLPEPADEAAFVKITRELLALPRRERGPSYLARALMLARSGARRGALEDAQTAAILGARGPNAEDAVALVRTQLRPRATAQSLPQGMHAYAVESDFEPGARRCEAGNGPRARVAATVAEMAAFTKAHEKDKDHPYDAALAMRVNEAVSASPLDPRAAALVTRSAAGSRWKLRREVIGNAQRVPRERVTRHEGPIENGAELRPRVLTGAPFEDGTYAILSQTRPAKAILAKTVAKSQLQIACVRRTETLETSARCPIFVTVGTNPPVNPEIGPDGRVNFPLNLSPDQPTPVTIALGEGGASWAVLTRIVFDREMQDATSVRGVGWILEPPHVDYRLLVRAGESVGVNYASSSLVRIDAREEPGSHARVMVTYDGKEESLSTDGEPIVVALPKAGPLRIKVVGGAATLAIAERVPKTEPLGEIVDDAPVESETADSADGSTALGKGTVDLDLSANSVAGAQRWRDAVDRSPGPLTDFQSSFGTLAVETGALYGNIRDAIPGGKGYDGYAFGFVSYRRRIEAIDLWTDFQASGRIRDGGPSTYNFGASFYEDAEKFHLRFTGGVDFFSQRVGDEQVRTFRPHGFAEYSWRVTRSFFVLPRVGYDGFYNSRPSGRTYSLDKVDDDVVNSYRERRSTAGYGQLLFWYTPYFNDIFYLRARTSFDPTDPALMHTALRPGFFLAFGQLDVNGYINGTRYEATETFAKATAYEGSGGLKVLYNFWEKMGSLNVQPGVGTVYRVNDNAWQATLFVNVLLSYRRGLRDYSSLDLDFPEQLGGGIPWRGATPGQYR